MPRLFLPLLLLCWGAACLSAQDADPAEYHFIQDPADLAPGGGLRDPGERIPVFFIPGFLKDDLKLERKIHVVFSFLHSQFIKKVNRKQNPFEHVFPVHYRYTPSKAYRELGRDFAARVKENFGELPCVLFVHSAGALIGRFAADAGLPVIAMIGLSPAHGGSPGATLMYANEKILEDGRVTKEHFDVMENTLAEIGVPDPVARSLAWDNSDGVMTPEEIKKYGLEVQPKLPAFRYDRFDHYGILKRFVAPFASFDFLGGQKKKGRKKSDRELEWELVGKFSPKWKQSDGVVVPYPKTAADGDTKVWTRNYTGIGHREIFIDRDVLDRGWDQVTKSARVLLGVEPAEAVVVAQVPDPTPKANPPPAPTAPPPPPTEAPEDDLDDFGDLDDLGDLDDPEGPDGLDEFAEIPRSETDPLDEPRPGASPVPVRPPVALPDALAEIDLAQVEATGLVPSWRRRPARRLGGDLFDGLDPERMYRWERR